MKKVTPWFPPQGWYALPKNKAPIVRTPAYAKTPCSLKENPFPKNRQEGYNIGPTGNSPGPRPRFRWHSRGIGPKKKIWGKTPWGEGFTFQPQEGKKLLTSPNNPQRDLNGPKFEKIVSQEPSNPQRGYENSPNLSPLENPQGPRMKEERKDLRTLKFQHQCFKGFQALVKPPRSLKKRGEIPG